MKFAVQFKLPTKQDLHVIGLTHDYGYNYIDVLRGEGKLFGLNLEDIDTDFGCPVWNKGVLRINLTKEDTIKQIPQLYARRSVEVTVPPGYMGRYMKLKVKPYYSERTSFFRTTKYVSSCEIFTKLDSEEVIQDWIEAGCPEIWGMPTDLEGNKRYEVTLQGGTIEDFVARNHGQMYSMLANRLCDKSIAEVLSKIKKVEVIPLGKNKEEDESSEEAECMGH